MAKKYKTFYKFCLPWCKTDDSLIMVGRIPVRGYIPGQTIELFLNVYNRTEQRVSEFKVQLMKVSVQCVPVRIQYFPHISFSPFE